MNAIPKQIVIILIAVLAALTLYLFVEYCKYKKLDGLRKKAYELILIAEHSYLHGENREKLTYVVKTLYLMLPEWLKCFVTVESLMDLVNIWFQEIKDLLDDGKINESSEPPKEETSSADVSPEEQTENE